MRNGKSFAFCCPSLVDQRPSNQLPGFDGAISESCEATPLVRLIGTIVNSIANSISRYASAAHRAFEVIFAASTISFVGFTINHSVTYSGKTDAFLGHFAIKSLGTFFSGTTQFVFTAIAIRIAIASHELRQTLTGIGTLEKRFWTLVGLAIFFVTGICAICDAITTFDHVSFGTVLTLEFLPE